MTKFFRFLWTLFVGLFFLGLAATVYAGVQYKNFAEQPLNIPADGASFNVKRGMGLRKVMAKLQQDGVTDQFWTPVIVGRLSGKSAKIKAGEYRLHQGMTGEEMLDMLVEGKTEQFRITFKEGWAFEQMMDAMVQHGEITMTLHGFSQSYVMRELGIDKHLESIGVTPERVEGWIAPDTYYFQRGYTDADLLKKAFALQKKRLEAAWANRSAEVDAQYGNIYGALTMASIVEKEAQKRSERPIIAGVFLRRLQKGWKLQADATIRYGLGDFGSISDRDLRNQGGYNPYDTYKIQGLTPTPIANPGKAAIQAAMQPQPGNTMFFVTTKAGDGSHYFSVTNEEHVNATRCYRDKSQRHCRKLKR